jgi:hypothetical protein
MRRLAFLLLFCSANAMADEVVNVCFNYGCAAEEVAVFSEVRLAWAQEMLATADTAARERQLLSMVTGRLYFWAGQQTAIHADRGGNFDDDGVRGAMDCIDHSTTTTSFLRLLERRGALRFHRVLDPVQRGWVFQHYSAQIEEIGSSLRQAETEHVRRFAVDSWYVDNGRPAPVIPLELWQEGNDPDV